MRELLRRRSTWGAIGLALVLVLLFGALMPDSSDAADIPLLPDSLPSLDPSHYVVEGFKNLLIFIFGDPSVIGRKLVNMLLAVPILTDKDAFPGLNKYRVYIAGGAWGILGLSFVVATMRYWMSSYSGSGAYEALTGFVRTCLAIIMLMIFPIVFDQVSRFVNVFTAWLVDNPLVSGNLSKGMVGTLAEAPLVGGGMVMIITIIALIMALVLLAVKVVITCLLAVLFVLSPLAIALFPIEELSWCLRQLVQSMLALLMFPVLWAICFATFAMLSADSLFPGSHGDTMNVLLTPLITLASLIVAFRLPFAVLSQAMMSGISPGLNHSVIVMRSAGSNVRKGLKARPGT